MTIKPLFTLPPDALLQMRAAAIDSISPRGQEDKDSTRLGRIIHALFNATQAQPPATLSWREIWQAGWPEEYKKHGADGDAALAYGEKIRGTVYKVRKALDKFSVSTKGRKLELSAVLPRKHYRLEFYKNQPDRVELMPVRPVEPKTIIGLVFGREEEWFQGELIAGAELGARAAGYRLLVTFNSMDWQTWRTSNLILEAEQLRAMSEQCAGLIVIPSIDHNFGVEEFDEAYEELLDAKYPFAFAERRAYRAAPLIASANESGGSMATRYLVSDCGCNKVIVVLESLSGNELDKLQGHFSFMRELHGEEFSPIITTEDEPWTSAMHFRRLLERELEAHNEPIGVFATNDLIAYRVRKSLGNLDSAQQGRVHVIGYGGMSCSQDTTPPFVSMYQDYHRVGYEAAKAVTEMISDARASKTKEATHYERRLPVKYMFDFDGITVIDSKLPSLQGTKPGDLIR